MKFSVTIPLFIALAQCSPGVALAEDSTKDRIETARHALCNAPYIDLVQAAQVDKSLAAVVIALCVSPSPSAGAVPPSVPSTAASSPPKPEKSK